MGFLHSFAVWLILSIIVAVLLFTVFFFILSWIYPVAIANEISNDDVQETQQRLLQSRRLVGIFILVAVLLIMTISGINALMTMY